MSNQRPDRTVRVLGIRVDPLDMASALAAIEYQVTTGSKGYVCLIGVHGIMEAYRDSQLATLYECATLMVPDGMPTVWIGHAQGFSHMQRVTGPDLMLEVFRSPRFAHCAHFLYGGKPGVAEELKAALGQRFPRARIVGTYTPPFRILTSFEEDELVDRLNDLKPHFLWVGISTPRQEQFMASLLPRLERTLMFGVGAAFDFHTGRIKDAPQWIKRAGLQWLHRLFQDPRHLLGRYLRNNSAFLWNLALQPKSLRRYTPAQNAGGLPAHEASIGTQTVPDLDV